MRDSRSHLLGRPESVMRDGRPAAGRQERRHDVPHDDA